MPPLKLVYYGLMVVSLIAYLYRRNKLSGKFFLIPPLLICSIAIEVIVDSIAWLHGQRYWVLFHIYQPVEYVLIALMFYFNLKNQLTKRLIALSIPLYFLLLIGYYTFHPDYIHTLRYTDFVLESFFLSIWALLALIELVNLDELTEPITHIPLFWIAFAVLLFYAGSIFIMTFRYYLDEYNRELSSQLFEIQHYLNLVFYLLLIVTFLWVPTLKTSSSA
jgi:hypothetical protein